ncbi:group II intron reverse transcriptase/maturase [Bacillus cereus]|uniref:group II intron reverse transcriptase/maturase n=1 Tax=Bacillus cereus TaxID=1396 RepID=UPI003B3BA31F
MQEDLDKLYSKSQEGKYFKNLVKLMQSDKNIMLAYRNIKRNTGKNTPGVDGLTTKDIAKLPAEDIIKRIKDMFTHYKPKPVKRVWIPKPNGKERPLGIPCIWDRLFQQCILQILEPICEAKFHRHSYGFRPNRSASHAIARMSHLINQNGLYHCVDIDIKGFFDNVNHGKLLKQMWSLGIRDKKLLSIISVLVKAEIQGEGVPNKGTPQGGILSPLLSNIVLNELDWWISNQWETFETKKNYTQDRTGGSRDRGMDESHKYRALKTTKMKEIYIVRYADDFKILCRTRSQAIKIKFAVEDFLNKRLKLECSEEKSKVVNLKKHYSEFLGIELKAVQNGKKIERVWKKRSKTIDGKRKFWSECISETKITKYTATSRMTEKAKRNAILKITKTIKEVKKSPKGKNVRKLNSVIYGIQNYYQMATRISLDLGDMNNGLRRVLYNRLKNIWKDADPKDMDNTQKRRYKGHKVRMYKIGRIVIAPISAYSMQIPLRFTQKVCNYTEEGRKLIHKNLKISPKLLAHISTKFSENRTIEYHDNRISKFAAQNGKCAITGYTLGFNDWHCHHIEPFHISKDDSYRNLIILHEEIHKLVHLKDDAKIQNLLKLHNIKSVKLEKLNDLREKVGLEPIKGTKTKKAA